MRVRGNMTAYRHWLIAATGCSCVLTFCMDENKNNDHICNDCHVCVSLASTSCATMPLICNSVTVCMGVSLYAQMFVCIHNCDIIRQMQIGIEHDSIFVNLVNSFGLPTIGPQPNDPNQIYLLFLSWTFLFVSVPLKLDYVVCCCYFYCLVP